MSLDIELAVPEAYHLRRFLVGHQMGRYGPTLRISDHMAQGASNKPEGPACFAASRAERHVDLRIHGPGREWLAGRAMGLLGLLDDPYRFDPKDRVVRRMWRQSYGMHLPRLPLVFDRLVQIVLLQLVTWKSGLGTWRRLVETFGQEAPGPCELKVPPSPTALVALDADERVALGIQPRQARTLRRAAKEASRIESAAERGSQALGDVRGSALADSDAVLVGTTTCRAPSPGRWRAKIAQTTNACWSSWSPSEDIGFASFVSYG